MRICVLMLYTEGWSDIANIVLPNAKEYCERHGYHLEGIMYRQNDFKLDFGYNKLLWIQCLFEKDLFDMIWSLDMDTLITNHNYRIEDFIKDEDFYIAKDVNGINGGSFIIKKSNWSMSFLNELLDLRGKEGMHCEQDAMRAYFEKNGYENVKILPHPSINSYKYELYPEFDISEEIEGQWKAGNFVLHLPALSIEKRLQILKNTPVVK